MTVLERIEEKLTAQGVSYRITTHGPVYTSAEAAAARGTALSSGAKALVLKAGEAFVLFVMPADRKLDSKRVRKNLGFRELRFATREEVFALTGLQPGAIPPFGSLFGLKTYCDRALGQNERINFNPGSHTTTLEMGYEDYVRVEGPEMAEVTEAPAREEGA
ncbi:MAG: hypothetical protein EXS64_04205 [Candidatus Latescibacteria bacterium]|nr:hypothetical protein [Candidatus Latescibacterota bacterium]